MTRVFLSSTKTDLVAERNAVCERLATEVDVIRMEDFGSDNLDTFYKCLSEVETCDALELLLGHRYGSLVPDSEMSYTHLEYERARESNVVIFAYIKEGFDAALDEADHPQRLKDFRDQIEDAHTVEQEYFTSPELLADQVARDMGRWLSRGAKRPAFTKRLGAIKSPPAYGAGMSRHALLQLSTYPVVIVDLTAIDAVKGYPSEKRGRIGKKVVAIADELRNYGAQVTIFNDLPSYAPPTELAARRAARVVDDAAAIICFAPREEDFGKLELFTGTPEKLKIWYPERLAAPGIDAQILVRTFTDTELQECSVALDVMGYMRDLVDRHVLDRSIA